MDILEDVLGSEYYIQPRYVQFLEQNLNIFVFGYFLYDPDAAEPRIVKELAKQFPGQGRKEYQIADSSMAQPAISDLNLGPC